MGARGSGWVGGEVLVKGFIFETFNVICTMILVSLLRIISIGYLIFELGVLFIFTNSYLINSYLTRAPGLPFRFAMFMYMCAC